MNKTKPPLCIKSIMQTQNEQSQATFTTFFGACDTYLVPHTPGCREIRPTRNVRVSLVERSEPCGDSSSCVLLSPAASDLPGHSTEIICYTSTSRQLMPGHSTETIYYTSRQLMPGHSTETIYYTSRQIMPGHSTEIMLYIKADHAWP